MNYGNDDDHDHDFISYVCHGFSHTSRFCIRPDVLQGDAAVKERHIVVTIFSYMCMYMHIHIHTYTYTLWKTERNIVATIFIYAFQIPNTNFKPPPTELYICNIYMHIHACIHIHILRSTPLEQSYTCVCVCVCMYIYIYIYIYT